MLPGTTQVAHSSIPPHLWREIELDQERFYRALDIDSNSKNGSFTSFQKSQQLFVYEHPVQIKKNSSVGIKAWDKVSIISMVSADLGEPPAPLLDLLPFLRIILLWHQ